MDKHVRWHGESGLVGKLNVVTKRGRVCITKVSERTLNMTEANWSLAVKSYVSKIRL